MQPYQFKLTDCFVFTAFCAAICAVGVFFQFGGLFWFHLIACAVCSLSFLVITCMPNSPVLRGLAYIIPTFGFMLLLPSVLLIFIVMLYLTVAYFVAANSRPDFRRSLLISFGLAVVALGIATIWGTTKYYQLAAWRTEYPIQSLASRLAYEPPQSTLEADVLFMLSNAVQKNLEAVEVIDDSWRGRQLAMLHNINFGNSLAV